MMDPILGAFEKRLRSYRLPASAHPLALQRQRDLDQSRGSHGPRLLGAPHSPDGPLLRLPGPTVAKPEQILIEVGPGNALTSLARQQSGGTAKAFQSLPHPHDTISGLRFALETLGQLWVSGVNIDWSKLHAPHSVRRVSLPTYPFEHQKYWIEADKVHPATPPAPAHSLSAAPMSGSTAACGNPFR